MIPLKSKEQLFYGQGENYGCVAECPSAIAKRFTIEQLGLRANHFHKMALDLEARMENRDVSAVSNSAMSNWDFWKDWVLLGICNTVYLQSINEAFKEISS